MISFDFSQEEFLEDYFEKKFFYRKNSLSYAPISFSEINQIIYAWEPSDPMLKLHFGGQVLPAGEFLETYQDVSVFRPRINPEKFVGLLESGATLVLNRLDKKLPSIGQLCYEISKFANEKAVANGYVAFGGNGTFGRHWDTHDVFAVQLIGRKYWKVYPPTYPLPLPQQTSKNFKELCPQNAIFDGILEEGDVLYLPRGWWHEAIPIPNEPTAHVAVGLHTPKVIDYMSWVLENKFPDNLSVRSALIKNSNNMSAIGSAAIESVEDFSNSEYVNEFLLKMGGLVNFHNDRFLPSFIFD